MKEKAAIYTHQYKLNCPTQQ